MEARPGASRLQDTQMNSMRQCLNALLKTSVTAEDNLDHLSAIIANASGIIFFFYIAVCHALFAKQSIENE